MTGIGEAVLFLYLLLLAGSLFWVAYGDVLLGRLKGKTYRRPKRRSWAEFAGYLLDCLKRWKLLYIFGFLFLIISFLGLPWVRLNPWEYVKAIPAAIRGTAPDIMDWLFRLLDIEPLDKLWGFVFNNILRIPGTWTVLITAFLGSTASVLKLGGGSSLAFRLFLPGLLWVGLTAPLGWIVSICWHKLCSKSRFMGMLAVVQGMVAALVACLLVLCIPELDALGTSGTLIPGIFATLLKAQLGYGVWVALLGLLLLAGAGVLDFQTISAPRPKNQTMSGQPATSKGPKVIRPSDQGLRPPRTRWRLIWPARGLRNRDGKRKR